MDADLDVMALLDEAAVNYQIVLTKSDKVKPTALAKTLDHVAAAIAKRPAAHPVLRATSALKGDGLAELRADIAALTTQ